MKIHNKILLAAMVLLAACNSKDDKDKAKESDNINYEEVASAVDTMHLRYSTFNEQIVCNGKLRAVQKSQVNFKTQGIIFSINVKNGMYVKKGEVLASLDKEDILRDLSKSKRNLEKARINLMDKLIGQGYDTDTTNVPKMILENAKNSSGYFDAQDNLHENQRKLKDADVIAPFAGKIANLNAKEWDNASKELCMLIDDKTFDVEFSLLEAEMYRVKVGQRVKITPFISSEDEYIGYVTEKNPLVDDKGQVVVRAKVENKDGKLVEGMNVRILLENKLESLFVVPKDAVLLRDNYYLVFRYVDGEAVWTYVDVMMSNIDSHVITGNKIKQTTLSENDIIITSGNLNLADGVKVQIKQTDK